MNHNGVRSPGSDRQACRKGFTALPILVRSERKPLISVTPFPAEAMAAPLNIQSQQADIQREQAHIDRAYARLDAMRAAAIARRDEVIGNSQGGTHQAREERDVIVRTALARLEQLRLGDESLSFGRIDRTTGERFYIGRLAISDVD